MLPERSAKGEKVCRQTILMSPFTKVCHRPSSLYQHFKLEAYFAHCPVELKFLFLPFQLSLVMFLSSFTPHAKVLKPCIHRSAKKNLRRSNLVCQRSSFDQKTLQKQTFFMVWQGLLRANMVPAALQLMSCYTTCMSMNATCMSMNATCMSMNVT